MTSLETSRAVFSSWRLESRIDCKETAITSKFILNENVKGCFQFTLLAPGDQVLLTSPSYADREQALSRIDTVRSLARHGRNLDVCSTGDGQFYIVLKDNKGKVLGQSGIFVDRQSLQKGIDAIKKCSSRTKVLDLTRLSGAAVFFENLQPSRVIHERKAKPSRIILKQNVKGYYSFILQSPNGWVLLTSPFFTDKKYTLSRIALARSLAQKNERFEVRTAQTGQLYIVLTNNKHEVVAQSPLFSHIRSMRKWNASIKECVCGAMLCDLTHNN